MDGSNDLYHGLEKRNTNSLNAYPFDDSETSTGERHSMCERYAGLGSYITSMLGSKQAIFPLIFPLVFVACGWALRGWVCFIAPIYYPRKRAHTFFSFQTGVPGGLYLGQWLAPYTSLPFIMDTTGICRIYIWSLVNFLSTETKCIIKVFI